MKRSRLLVKWYVEEKLNVCIDEATLLFFCDICARTLTLINGFYGSFVSGLNEFYVYIFWKSVVERKKKNLNIYKTPAVNIK